MSGGIWDYIQFKLDDVADDIEETVSCLRQDVKKDNRVTIEKLEEAIKAIKTAAIYIQRVDWLLAGDDDDDSFISRLEMELKELKGGEE